MQGIGQGFYDNPEYLIDDRCLGTDAIRAIDNLVEGFRHGINAFDKVLKSMTAVVTLFVSVTNNCRSSQFLYDFISICFLKGSCSGFKLIVNLSLNSQEILIASGQLLLTFITFW